MGEAVVVVRVAVILAVGLTAAYLLALHLRRTGMFFPDRYPSGDWDTTRYAIAPQDVLFPSRDGTNLHGWLFRAATTPHAPLMVFFHGNAGNLTDRAPVSAELARRGISVLVFDWRGYGKSEGTPREERLYDDALAAYDFASKIEPSIAVYGESLGSPFAAWVAKHRRVRCAIIDSGFPSLMAMGNAHYFPLGYFAPRAMRTAAWLNDANVPVLVIHGKRDDVAPFALGQSLSDSLHGRKEMLVGETSGHCELESRAPQRYYETVTRFILESAR